MKNLDYWWQELIRLKPGERLGNHRGTVFCYEEYMLLEVKSSAKRTNCLDAARFLAGSFDFSQVRELND